MQKYTSAQTSINSSKLPAIYSKINWQRLSEKHSGNSSPIVLDYGAGKYREHIKTYVESKGFVYKAYDPYNGSDEDWNSCDPSLIICSNVLNVIDSDKVVNEIHDWIYNQKVPYAITVYEGSLSGTGKPTKKDCYQRNQRLSSYKTKNNEIIYKNVLTTVDYICYIK